MLNAEGEEPIPNLASLLPNLEALSMPEWGKTTAEDYTELLSANPLRKVTYLKSGFFPYDEHKCHLIPQYAPSLQCLELSPYIQEIRGEGAEYHTMKTLLALMPDLSELAIHFSSGRTMKPWYREDNETYPKPLPMDKGILSKIIKALPKSSNLQVLRMKDLDDGKGLPLEVQSSTFAFLR